MTIKGVILGGTGYVGGELLRLLAGHPEIDLTASVSGSQTGKPVSDTFPHLQATWPALNFCSMAAWTDDLERGDKVAVFSAAPHAASAALVRQVLDTADEKGLDLRIVDSSADFRYSAAEQFESVYGSPHAAPELLDQFFCAVPEHSTQIEAPHAGHPGCFATSMLLSIVPLFTNKLVSDNVYVSAITGSTGSGKTPQGGTHHPERHSNLYAYKPLSHRHVPEVQNLVRNASGVSPGINFVPHSGPFARGIYATTQAALQSDVTADDVRQLFQEFYADSQFVQVVSDTPRLKNVVASNYAHIGVDVGNDSVVVMCAIDNLVKGAAGGAIQWMNRLWGLPEESGLTSAPPAWT